MEQVDLKIPGRKGPFYLRRMRLHEVMEYMRKVNEWGEVDAMRRLVQQSLYTKSGAPVYSDKQLDKMDDDLGGVEIMSLSIKAQEINQFEKLNSLGDQVEAAEKN